VAAGAAGCASIGPRTIARDRFNYTAAVADSYNEQLLLNVVRLRYADAPTLLEVAQIVNSYELRREGHVGVEVYPNSADDFLNLGANASFVDRPTITYSLVSGERFSKMLLAPVPPEAIAHLVRAGYQAKLLLPLFLHTINGSNNPLLPGAGVDNGVAFDELMVLLGTLQRVGALDFRFNPANGAAEALLLGRRSAGPQAEATAELRQRLGLSATQAEVPLAFGVLQAEAGQLSLFTTSMLQTLGMLAAAIDLPAEHTASGMARARDLDWAPRRLEQFRVHTGRDRPREAHVAVRYLDHWFWIDRTDYQSKLTFLTVGMMLRILEAGRTGPLPLLTIPTG
jgi:hypothetical protein